MEFFTAGVGVLKTLVTAIGAGLGAWELLTWWKVMVMITLVLNLKVLSNLWQNKDGITQQIL